MHVAQFNEDASVRRLRWAVAGFMLFCGALTLIGQPATFWHHPGTAMRWDGLPIDAPLNASFEFFLGKGWGAYAATYLLYVVSVFGAISLLPRRPAFATGFAFLFGHFYGLSNWMVVRWHLGISGTMVAALALGIVVMLCIDGDIVPNAKRVRWLPIAALFGDMTATLIGQPQGYWLNPHIVHEANTASRFFLEQGWAAYVLYDFVLAVGLYWLIQALPRGAAFAVALAVALEGYAGASNWLFYEWRLGLAVPVFYGALLGIALAMLLLSPQRKDQ